jgi:hypothetical protein
MGQGDVQVGEWGFSIEFVFTDKNGAPIDISAATSMLIIIRKPNGVKLTKTASFTTDGKDGKIKYTTVNGDFDIPSSDTALYKAQGIVSCSSWNHPSSVEIITVNGNI